MNHTKIEWVKNPDGTQGYTWNPLTGCLNHVNGMCKGGNFPCYAYRLAHGRLQDRYLANSNLPQHDELDHEVHHNDPFYPRFWWGKLAEMVNQQGTKPKGIFVCDMAELFGDWVPEQWQHRVFSAIKVNPQHRFYLLTKQPQNLIKWSPFPDNCWIGVTATNHAHYLQAVAYLRDVEASIKFLSLEPLLHKIDVGYDCFDWLIIGGQTKPQRLPEIEWVKEIVEAADEVGTKVFLKDNLNPIFAANGCKGFMNYRDKLFTFKDFDPSGETRWHLRQEMPK